jgi:hypothetical protein
VLLAHQELFHQDLSVLTAALDRLPLPGSPNALSVLLDLIVVQRPHFVPPVQLDISAPTQTHRAFLFLVLSVQMELILRAKGSRSVSFVMLDLHHLLLVPRTALCASCAPSIRSAAILEALRVNRAVQGQWRSLLVRPRAQRVLQEAFQMERAAHFAKQDRLRQVEQRRVLNVQAEAIRQ